MQFLSSADWFCRSLFAAAHTISYTSRVRCPNYIRHTVRAVCSMHLVHCNCIVGATRACSLHRDSDMLNAGCCGWCYHIISSTEHNMCLRSLLVQSARGFFLYPLLFLLFIQTGEPTSTTIPEIVIKKSTILRSYRIVLWYSAELTHSVVRSC